MSRSWARATQASADARRTPLNAKSPDGGVRVLDFEWAAKDVQRALRDVEHVADVTPLGRSVDRACAMTFAIAARLM